MKKRILFMMPSMFIGGAERSLLGLLEVIDYNRYDVDLFLYRHEGEFLQLIPKEVRILPPIREYATFDVPIVSLLRSDLWKFGIARIAGKIRLKRFKIKQTEAGIWAAMQCTSRSLQPLLPTITGEYDLAVSFLGIPDVLLNKVQAKKKVAWNHTDYTVLGADSEYDRMLYKKIDSIISVSEPCTEQFLQCYPELKKKALTIENVLSKRLIEQQASEQIEDIPNDGTVKILSVGRFSDAKNFDNVPDICRRVIESGINAKWYLIGYGGDETLIKQKIVDAGMEDRVIILGKKENPYPYIKACDLYAQPSRYEGKCVSVREAQLLGKPVVITRYATSTSQLEEGVDGIIVPMDNEGAAAGIVDLLRNPKRMKELCDACSMRDYTNAKEVAKVYRLLEG